MIIIAIMILWTILYHRPLPPPHETRYLYYIVYLRWITLTVDTATTGIFIGKSRFQPVYPADPPVCICSSVVPYYLSCLPPSSIPSHPPTCSRPEVDSRRWAVTGWCTRWRVSCRSAQSLQRGSGYRRVGGKGKRKEEWWLVEGGGTANKKREISTYKQETY